MSRTSAKKPKTISVRELFTERGQELKLELLSGGQGLKRCKISSMDIHRPGLALAGFTGDFPSDRLQVLGNTEMAFLKTFDPSARRLAVTRVTGLRPPCFVVTNNAKPPAELREEMDKAGIPLLVSRLTTNDFIHLVSDHLELALAPETYVHGDLVDVYGIGLLITGDSGIGKSETALDLVERGHRLVADDLIKVQRRRTLLMGEGAERRPAFQHHMEIRGLGIINLYSIFGIRAIRLQKRVECIVELKRWEKGMMIDRLGLERDSRNILGVKIPLLTIPVLPGRNLAMICEVIAMNHLVVLRGYHPMELFDRELKKLLQSKIKVAKEVEEDVE
ncbi:HPr(Ser) kinase/phosphatase [candidate division WOR-3 bacterium]|uniref:HPr kinase/phosphorylase n=1 Tax=candidate division WOR-3 bacterium TaxID=2052148 RepID=A0A9D5KA21_UNCW3|nr:HPr(Ser) kinase/phosphatase [candidate division WOR-3 bacterium]MBD3364850.1 HPr(Ser) kinase/phosphatase [candidate division WOR-3 bacterium]